MGNCNIQPSSMIQVGDYEFNPNDVLGVGHHGTIFQGSPRNEKLFEIAIKQIKHNFDAAGLRKAKALLSNLQSIQHENIVQCIDSCYDERDKKLYMIIEFCAHGNLHDLMQSDLKFSPLSDLKLALSYCSQLIKGLVALHDNNIVHQNLRPHNILIHYEKIKITDFGLTDLERMSIRGQSIHGPSIYRAPELMAENSRPDAKSDIWSLGVIMYQVIYKTKPIDIGDGVYKVCELSKGKCAALDDVIKRCLCLDPEQRMSTGELKAHPFLSFNPRKSKNIYEEFEVSKI